MSPRVRIPPCPHSFTVSYEVDTSSGRDVCSSVSWRNWTWSRRSGGCHFYWPLRGFSGQWGIDWCRSLSLPRFYPFHEGVNSMSEIFRTDKAGGLVLSVFDSISRHRSNRTWFMTLITNKTLGHCDELVEQAATGLATCHSRVPVAHSFGVFFYTFFKQRNRKIIQDDFNYLLSEWKLTFLLIMTKATYSHEC